MIEKLEDKEHSNGKGIDPSFKEIRKKKESQ